MLLSIAFTTNDLDQIWKMRARYHRFDGIFVGKQGWSMVYLHGNEAAWAIPLSRSCDLAVYSRVNYKKWLPRLSEDEIAQFWYWTEEIKENANLKPCQEIGKRFEECLREGNFLKNLEIFLINNKAIIEFGFLMTWRIMLISEDVIHLDRWKNSTRSA